MSTPNLTVIGLDAATFDVVDPLLGAANSPISGGLSRKARTVYLRSTTHPLTPQAWSTMVTGVNAGGHGIWDFAERDDSGYGSAPDQRQLPPRACDLGPAGRGRPPRGVVNIPFTWPAPELDGGSRSPAWTPPIREQGMTAPTRS